MWYCVRTSWLVIEPQTPDPMIEVYTLDPMIEVYTPDPRTLLVGKLHDSIIILSIIVASANNWLTSASLLLRSSQSYAGSHERALRFHLWGLHSLYCVINFTACLCPQGLTSSVLFLAWDLVHDPSFLLSAAGVLTSIVSTLVCMIRIRN